jgi:hypothetical protein
MARLPMIGGLWRKLAGNPKRIERFVKFAIVGTIGAVVDFTVLNIMKIVFEGSGFGEGWDVSMSARQIQCSRTQQLYLESPVDLSRVAGTSVGHSVAAVHHCQHHRACDKHSDTDRHGPVSAAEHPSRAR